MQLGQFAGMGMPQGANTQAAQPSFWQQMIQRQRAQQGGGMNPAAQSAGNAAQMNVGTAGGLASGGPSPMARPGMNMDQMPSANPQLQALRARAAAMQAGGAQPSPYAGMVADPNDQRQRLGGQPVLGGVVR